MGRKLRYPILNNRERQNADVLLNKDILRGIFFRIHGGELSKFIGTVPRNSIIAQPTFVNILEPFDGTNIYLNVGTRENPNSVGKVLSHNAGVFGLSNTAFSTVPVDYGRILTVDKDFYVTLIASSNSVTTRGSMFGILYYTDLTTVEGF